MSVPTNKELYDNAPEDAFDAVKGWLSRHQPPGEWSPVRSDYKSWLDWATANFFLDPEIRGAFKKEFGITWNV